MINPEGSFDQKSYSVELLGCRFFRKPEKMYQRLVQYAIRNGINLHTIEGTIDAHFKYGTHVLNVAARWTVRAAKRKGCLLINEPEPYWSPYNVLAPMDSVITIGVKQQVIRRDELINRKWPDRDTKLMLPPSQPTLELLIPRKVEAIWE